MRRLSVYDYSSSSLSPKIALNNSSPALLPSKAGFRVVSYDIPTGCIGAYYPEANALLPIWHYAEGSKTPAAKSIPVVVKRRN